MPQLPEAYNEDPAALAAAELLIREEIVAMFLDFAAPFGFDANTAHERMRYPDNKTGFELLMTVEDPDTAEQPPEKRRHLIRYFAVEWDGQSQVGTTLTIRYLIKISFEFKDVYATDANRSSCNELVGLAMMFGRHLANNRGLGFTAPESSGVPDSPVTHDFFRVTGKRFVPIDRQGRSTQVIDGALNVNLEVC
jgi:hypothetical protein